MPDVVGHEYTHAVINKMKPLNGFFESALDEALADITALSYIHSSDERTSRPGDHVQWYIGYDPHKKKPIRDLNSTNHSKQFAFCLAQQNLKRLGQNSEKLLLKAWWQAYEELDLSPKKKEPIEDFIVKVEEFKGLVFKYCSSNGNLGPEATRQCVIPAWNQLWDMPLQRAFQK